jgi:hypothetical protein
MFALYFLQPVGNNLSQRRQQGRVLRRHGGGGKPLGKAVPREMLLKPLKIGGHSRLLFFVRHCPISQKRTRHLRRVQARKLLQPRDAARNARMFATAQQS